MFILFFIFLFQAIDDDSRKTVNLSPYKPSERRLSPSSSSSAFSVSSDASYVVQAGKLITQGLEYEAAGQLEESFDLFKAGVDVLLSGVQSKCEYHEIFALLEYMIQMYVLLILVITKIFSQVMINFQWKMV